MSSSAAHRFRYVGLLYCARSGSTFLARQLADHTKDVAVIPEFRLPLLLLWMSEDQVRRLTRDELFRLFTDDFQLRNLFANQAFLNEAANDLAGRGTRQIIDFLISRYLQQTGITHPKIVLLKNSEFAHVTERLTQTIPDIRFIHIVRDPRGVANSLVSTKDPYDSNRPMARGDVLYAAKLWQKYVARIHALVNSGYSVTEIQYEDLLDNPNSVVSEIAKWLSGNERSPQPQAKPGGFVIKGPEQSIHRLINRGPEKSRIEAWLHELRPNQQYAIELLVRKELGEYGFSAQVGQGGMRTAARTLPVWFWHYLTTIKHYSINGVRAASWLVTDRRRFRVRVRQMLMRFAGKN